MAELSFVVYGIPQPQGSLRAVTNRKTGKAVLISDRPKLKAWRELVAKEAWAQARSRTGAAMMLSDMLSGSIAVDLHADFVLLRPQRAAHEWPRVDLDKLIRSIGDALTGVIYKDDAQIVRISASKAYSQHPSSCGAAIRVKALG